MCKEEATILPQQRGESMSSKGLVRLTPYIFIFPAMILLLVFKIYPIISAFIQSFLQTGFGVNQRVSFVGLDNYISLFTDPEILNSIKVTLWLNLLINPIQIILAFALALFLNQKLKGIGLFRSIHFIPIAVSMPIAAIIWSVMLDQEQGVINSILVKMGFESQAFLGDADQALWMIILIATWKGVGYWAIFLIAGLQEVPHNLYEAADIDGAGKWRKFKSITLPLMKRPLLFVVVADTVANFLLFAPMYIMTNGGPQGSTNVLMLESYKSAFVYSDIHRASAIVILLLVIILVIIAIQSRLLKADH